MNFNYPTTSFLSGSSLAKVARTVIHSSSNCVDVGAHKGSMLKHFARHAKKGMHYAIEPVPDLMQFLKNKYGKYENIRFIEKAIGMHSDHQNFMYVLSNPSLSGLKQRPLPKRAKSINILVQTISLSDLLPLDYKIDVLKIDVCGGEQQVLMGGLEKLKDNRPHILFRHYHKELSCYDSKPEETYQLVTRELNMKIQTPSQFLQKGQELSQNQFEDIFWKGDDKYFVASPNA